MEAIMIAGVAVVAVGGWYSVVDMLADLGITIGRRSRGDEAISSISCSVAFPAQRRIKQVARVHI